MTNPVGLSSPERAASPMAPERLPTGVFYAPLFAWLAVSGLTIYCYAGGPYVFGHTSWAPLYVYLVAVHVSIVAGYVLAVRRYREARSSPISPSRIALLTRWVGWISLAGVVVGIAAGGDIRSAVERAIEDPDRARKLWIEQAGTSIVGYVLLFLSSLHFPLIANTFAYWRWLPWVTRVPAFAVIAWTIVGSVIGGSRHGTFAVLVAAGAAIAIGTFARRLPLRPRGALVLASVAVFGFALYSSFIAVNRSRDRIDDYGDYLRRQSEFPVDPSHYAFDGLPKVIEPAVLSGYFYFGHGYEGLAQALEAPFVGVAFGAGHSRVLIRNVARLFDDPDIERLSYFDRLVLENVTSGSLWVTIYPWIASDVTFPGSVLVMGVLAWLLATAWLDSLRGRNQYAPWVVAWIAYTIASTSSILPGGDYGALLSYWGSALLWFGQRRRASYSAAAGRRST